MATRSSILAWRIPVDRGAGWATVHRVADGYDSDWCFHAQWSWCWSHWPGVGDALTCPALWSFMPASVWNLRSIPQMAETGSERPCHCASSREAGVGIWSCQPSPQPEQCSSWLFPFLAMPCGMWNLSSVAKDQTLAPCTGSVESITGPLGKSLFLTSWLQKQLEAMGSKGRLVLIKAWWGNGSASPLENYNLYTE